MQIVTRASVPSEHSVEVGGRTHNLGVVKDLRKHPELDRFLPRDCEASMTWVRLEPDEVLEVHTHPISSLILVVEGRGKTIGDLERPLTEGDAVLVRPGDRHGFVGGHPNGFWGLSVQFEPRALYEDLSDPWVEFAPQAAPDGTGFAAFLADNERHVEAFRTHRMFTYAQLGRFDRSESRRKLLDALHVWSATFQRLIQLRCALSDDPRFAAVARRHRDDELGHDELLKDGRSDYRRIWDPYLEATSSWFLSKLTMIGDLERAVLVHLVIEAAGDVFYKKMWPYVSEDPGRDHFAVHNGADETHVNMVYGLLKEAPISDWTPFRALLDQGWSMMSALLGRVADMAVR